MSQATRSSSISAPKCSPTKRQYALMGWFALATLFFSLVASQTAWAVRPNEELLPATTKFCILISDLDELQTNFDLTQLGQMVNDPLMRPFVDDLRRQLRERIDEEGRSVGLTWDDVDAIDGGEICFAQIQPDGDEDQQATVVIIDVSGHQQQTQKVLAKIHRKQLELGATYSTELVPQTQTQLKIYTFPPENDGSQAEQRILFLHEEQLFGVNHKQAAIALRRRCEGEPTDRLADLTAYQGVMQRIAAEYEKQGDPAPHLRWFLEPYGFTQVRQLLHEDEFQYGPDMLQVWSDTGFREAIQGAGGFVNFAHQGRDVLHRSLIYAPPVKRNPNDQATAKYNSAARMLQFPHTSDLVPAPWIPRELASFSIFNWKVRDASVFVESLVDAILGGDDGEGTYVDIKDSLKNDENGPQLDVDSEFFALLDDRFIWMTDYETPVSPTSERIMVAVRTNNPEKLGQTIRKTMLTDDAAKEIQMNGFVVWEVDENNSPAVQNSEDEDGLAFIFGEDDDIDTEEEPLQPIFPYRLTTVAHGYMIIATDRELLESVLQNHESQQQLEACVDYRLVSSDLAQLGANQDSLRLFSRLDEQMRPTYELIQQGLMPQSETLFGKFINWYFEEADENPREQFIDGSKMPDFQIVRRYLGPTGLYLQTEENGWLIVGSLLSKESLPATSQVAEENAQAD